MKRVFIVHGWSGFPSEGWFPWLKSELEKKGFQVSVPALPDSDNPRIYNWVPALAEAVGIPDEETYFVGHSMGNQTIVRYLETLPEGIKVGGAVFVAGFLKRLTGLEPEELETRKHWLDSSINLEKVGSMLGKSIAIFSDDDLYVPLDNREEFEKYFNSKVIIEHAKGHMGSSDGHTELPSILNAVLEVAS